MSYPPQQPPQQPPWQGPPPQRVRPHKSHTTRNVVLICVGALVVIAIIAAAVGHKNKTPTAGGSTKPTTVSTTRSASPKSSSSSHAQSVPQRQTVTYVVTGSPGTSVTYGPEGSSLNGHVPMRVTASLGDPQYYSISAQLNGGGAVSCRILVDGKVISRARATGGYNIAQCEIVQGFSGGWQGA